jgi:transposase
LKWPSGRDLFKALCQTAIEELEARIARFDNQLLAGLHEQRNTLALLQTIPGVDLIGAAMLVVGSAATWMSLAALSGWPHG